MNNLSRKCLMCNKNLLFNKISLYHCTQNSNESRNLHRDDSFNTTKKLSTFSKTNIWENDDLRISPDALFPFNGLNNENFLKSNNLFQRKSINNNFRYFFNYFNPSCYVLNQNEGENSESNEEYEDQEDQNSKAEEPVKILNENNRNSSIFDYEIDEETSLISQDDKSSSEDSQIAKKKRYLFLFNLT